MKSIEVIDGKVALREAEMPLVGPCDILIKVKSTAVNRADLMQKKGLYPPPPGASEILGLECSGIVDAVGEKVTSRRVGDEVCALLAGGGYAEYVACPEFQAIPKPTNLNWEEASSLPEVYATCWLNLFIEGNLTNNNKVLFHAGASGIGTAGIQLCKAFNCESFVTAGNEEKIKYCMNLGASGGAVGIGVGNKVYMMENTWYTVISPESCSSILWRSWEYKEQAASALKLTGEDMKRLKLIDGIIKEPVGGAHSNREGAFEAVKNTILSSFEELKDLSDEEIVTSRMEKYAEMGVYKE